jgi:hypothetical protein
MRAIAVYDELKVWVHLTSRRFLKLKICKNRDSFSAELKLK